MQDFQSNITNDVISNVRSNIISIAKFNVISKVRKNVKSVWWFWCFQNVLGFHLYSLALGFVLLFWESGQKQWLDWIRGWHLKLNKKNTLVFILFKYSVMIQTSMAGICNLSSLHCRNESLFWFENSILKNLKSSK